MKIIFISLISLSLIFLGSCGKNKSTETASANKEIASHNHDGETGHDHSNEAPHVHADGTIHDHGNADAHDHDEDAVEVTDAQMKAVDIKIGNLEKRQLSNTIRANGELALNPQDKAEVTPLMGGIIKQVLVVAGRTVKAGQPVAYLENTEIVELQKNYLTAKKEALVAEQEYDRQKSLSEQGAGVQKTLQQATATYEIAKAQLTGLTKQLRQLSISPQQVSAGNMVTQIPINAPISGVVDRVNISTGSYVDTQTPLMSISNNDAVHCDMKIFEKDLHLVKKGQEVDIVLTNQPGVHLKGEVAEISKAFDNETKSIAVHVAIKDSKGVQLIPGMYATGLINIGTAKSLAVPNDAIINNDGKKYIFVLDGEHGSGEDKSFLFRKEEVIAGISDLGYTQITPIGKLPEDALIVTHNAFYIASKASDHGDHAH